MFSASKTAGPSGYNISRSVRLRSSASAYFNRTFGTPTNNIKWSISDWHKLGALGTSRVIYSADDGTTNNAFIVLLTTGDQLRIFQTAGGVNNVDMTTAAVFRDPSAFYNIQIVYDSANATSTDRIQIYVNNQRQSVTYATGPFAQNTASQFNVASRSHNISKSAYNLYFDGYLTEINFIDGQALTPSSFGSTNATTGVWQPAKYTGTYGTNGFYLNFSDNSAATAAAIGKDYSGNGNNWTPNNISVTAGATYDSMIDVPTPYADGGNGRGNYAVLNPLINSGYSTTYSEGNLQLSGTFGVGQASIRVDSGKWYVEMSYSAIGGTPTLVGPSGSVASISYQNDGNKLINSTTTSYGATYTTGDVIGCAFDVDSGTTEFFKNGVSQGSIAQALGTSVVFRTTSNAASGTNTLRVNFGQRPFSYTPPSGYKALNTYNLPASTITNGGKYMAATLYTGTLLSNSITNAGNFKPDLVWVKSRSAATDHKLTDSVRGVTKALISDTTGAETTDTQGLTAFNSNGFTVGTDINYNNLSATYVGWQWQAGQGSTSSNTSGTITSTVSVNATAGFSVVTYTGTGANATVGHGLGVAPKMVIVKNRSQVSSWQVGHQGLNGGTTPWNYVIELNNTGAQSASATRWQNTAPSSTVVTIGTDTVVNQSGSSMLMYCWAEIAGFSKFGSYTGNGSTDGVFVYLGFRPRWVMFKRTDAIEGWYIYDTSRDTYNVMQSELRADSSAAEANFASRDFLSNGFKIRTANGSVNASGGTYIYAAFAENPFANALAR